MLRLSNDQTKALANANYRAFEERTLVFLRAKYPRRSETAQPGEMRAYIRRMTRFAADHNVISGTGAQKLMVVHLDLNFPIPLPAYHAHLLSEVGPGEAHRIDRFIKALFDPAPPTLVTLDDDLPAARAAHGQ